MQEAEMRYVGVLLIKGASLYVAISLCVYHCVLPDFRLKHARQEIKKKQADLKKNDQGYVKQQAAHKTLLANISKLEAS